MTLIAGIYLGTLALTFIILILPPLHLRGWWFGEGWIYPHYERRDKCLVQCTTCRRADE